MFSVFQVKKKEEEIKKNPGVVSSWLGHVGQLICVPVWLSLLFNRVFSTIKQIWLNCPQICSSISLFVKHKERVFFFNWFVFVSYRCPSPHFHFLHWHRWSYRPSTPSRTVALLYCFDCWLKEASGAGKLKYASPWENGEHSCNLKYFFMSLRFFVLVTKKNKLFGLREGRRGDVICILKVVSRLSVFGGLLITKWRKIKLLLSGCVPHASSAYT